MAEFLRQENPEVAPRLCYTCGTHAGPWVNLMTYDPAGRVILLCAPGERRKVGCAGMIANLIGALSPAETAKLRAENEALHDELELVMGRLSRLRDGVVEAASA